MNGSIAAQLEKKLAQLRWKPRILVVEDNDRDLELIAKAIRECGCEMAGAHTGEEAIAKIKSDPDEFDLAMVDLALPGMSGVDVLREIKKLSPRTSAMIVTGVDRNHHLVLDAAGFAPVTVRYKPVTADHIREILLHHHLDSPC
jgi:CheY-like chemotaxis protein